MANPSAAAAAGSFQVPNLFSVKELVVVITGAGSGLGASFAHALAANGAAAVYIVGRRKEKLDHVVEAAVGDAKGRIVAIQGDVTSKDSLQSVVNIIRQHHNHIDVLLANSGIIGPKTAVTTLPTDRKPTVQEFADAMWAIPMGDFTQTMHVNVTGVFYTALAFLPLLDEGNKRRALPDSTLPKQKSQIVVTTSIAGLSRMPAAGFAYSASKAGANHLAKMLATYFVPYQIRCNTIAPGMFQSEMNPGQKDSTVEGKVPVEKCPMGRFGMQEEIVGAALFLMSSAGAYMDGVVLVDDGGRLSQLPGSY